MKKLKSRVSLVGVLRHDTRDREPINADPALKDENAYTKTYKQALELYGEKLPKKVRKNAVHAVEVVITASPEWFNKATEKQKEVFVHRSRKWLYDLFGRDNELLIAMHRDEKTDHIHGVFIPLVDGSLNAKKLIGGSSHRMTELQDDFYEKVARPLGMERGEKQTHRKHTEPKDLNRLMKAVEDRERAVERREEVVKLAATLDEKTLRKAVAERVVGLDQKGVDQCWAAMKEKGDELREAQRQIMTNTTEQKRGHSH